MANILVTGGAGYVGSVLVPALLKNGHKVRVLDNLMYGGESLLACFNYNQFEMVVGDITDTETARSSIKGMDIIIHLAAIVGFPACKKNPELAEKVNLFGTKVLNKERSKNQFILYASTGSNYGDIETEICAEETPLKPLTEYGLTKTKAEEHLLQTDGVIAFRFATAFGLSPRLRLDLLVNDFVYQALKSKNLIIYEKHFMRSFIEVRDMAGAFLFAINNVDKMKNNVYNVGDEDMNYTKEEVASEIKKKLDFYLHFAKIGEDLDKRNYYVSYEKIKKIGFKTKISLQDGIDNLIQGLKIISMSNKYSNI